MNVFRGFPIRTGVFLLVGALAATAALGDDKPPIRLRDVGKAAIEAPSKGLLTQSQPAPRAVAPTRPEVPAGPKVMPGKVRWHADFAAACAAATTSGKPVLLFHLMSKLDDRFC